MGYRIVAPRTFVVQQSEEELQKGAPQATHSNLTNKPRRAVGDGVLSSSTQIDLDDVEDLARP
jgi:hypothetical protein